MTTLRSIQDRLRADSERYGDAKVPLWIANILHDLLHLDPAPPTTQEPIGWVIDTPHWKTQLDCRIANKPDQVHRVPVYLHPAAPAQDDVLKDRAARLDAECAERAVQHGKDVTAIKEAQARAEKAEQEIGMAFEEVRARGESVAHSLHVAIDHLADKLATRAEKAETAQRKAEAACTAAIGVCANAIEEDLTRFRAADVDAAVVHTLAQYDNEVANAKEAQHKAVSDLDVMRIARDGAEARARLVQQSHERWVDRATKAESSLARSQQSVADYERLVETQNRGLACADKLRADAEQDRDSMRAVCEAARKWANAPANPLHPSIAPGLIAAVRVFEAALPACPGPSHPDPRDPVVEQPPAQRTCDTFCGIYDCDECDGKLSAAGCDNLCDLRDKPPPQRTCETCWRVVCVRRNLHTGACGDWVDKPLTLADIMPLPAATRSVQGWAYPAELERGRDVEVHASRPDSSWVEVTVSWQRPVGEGECE